MPLALLPYHEALRDYLRREEPRVWAWFAAHRPGEELADSVRFDLLKKTYRIEPAASPVLYELAATAAQSLSLDAPITLYQSQNPDGLNAALAYVPGEAHVVLSGPVQAKLNDGEMRALFGHELAHYRLLHEFDGELLVVDQILAALTQDEQAAPPHLHSARLFQLYNEIFGDRGALLAAGDPLTVVSMLVKIATGLDEVDPASYVRQADELLARRREKTSGDTHPETFIRARAVKLWHEDDRDAAAKIADMIEGDLALDELDLLGQERVSALTRRLIDRLLAHAWLRTDLVRAHARLFFPDYEPSDASSQDDQVCDDLGTDDVALQTYYSYVLLDFVAADRQLEEAPLAAALLLADNVGLKERFLEVVKKELKLTKKQLDRLDADKSSVIALAAREAVTP